MNEGMMRRMLQRLYAQATQAHGRRRPAQMGHGKSQCGWLLLERLRAAMLLSLIALTAVACTEPTTTAAEAQAYSATGEVSTAALTPGAAAVLAEVRRATQRFRDVNVAIAEGYLRDPTDMCVNAPMEGMPHQLGGLGIHYFRPDLLGITALEPRVDGTGTHTDFTQPALLVYEPQADGSLELVAIENLVFVDAWHAAGNTAPPSFLGNEYYRMHDHPETEADEAHGLAPHYELHVWLYRHNPNGIFMQFNPRASCEHHPGHAGAH
jgi:hypothetical protein